MDATAVLDRVTRLESSGANIKAAIVGLTILILEAFATFEQEATLVWPSQWSLVKFLYIANKVAPFLIVPWQIVVNVLSNPTPLQCKVAFAIPCLGMATSIIISEAMLYVRLYALSGCRRWAKVFLSLNAVVITLVSHIVLAFFIARGSWTRTRYEGFRGCTTESAKGSFVLLSYSLLLYSGLAAMTLSVYFGLRVFWTSRQSPLVKILYRDGTFYFIMLAVLAVANGVASLLLPPGYQFVLGPVQAVAHSVLSARMVLRLRQQARDDMGLVTMPSMAFAKR
ncbi:hypothetical protein BKA70DRAFT_289830 [Coprinopsis sp. MPI-PUGE-AT-0042]|nr:hypothetical protein BKA70DRAFT_289830 [Coprinopsis sp. MPI-PUGE-AT-0042]